MRVQDIVSRRADLAEISQGWQGRWVIGVVTPSREFTCERLFSKLKIVHYCPARVIESRGGVRRTVRRQIQPVFPRYMFLNFAPSDYDRLEKVSLFQGVLRMNSKPLVLPLKILRGLIDRELAGGFDQLILSTNSFSIGDRVEIQWETLTMHGVVAKIIGRRKAIIDIAARRVTVPVAQLVRLC